MEFNKRKFNIIVTFTVCLICVVLVFSAVNFSAAGKDSIDNTIADSDDNETDLEEGGEENNTGSSNNSNTINRNLNMNSSKDRWIAINSALLKLKEQNYKLSLVQNVDGAALGFSGGQSISNTLYSVDGKYYTKTVSSGMGPNFTDYIFTDGTSVISNRNKSSNVTTSYNNYLSQNGLAPGVLNYNISSSTVTITKYEANPKNRKEYIFTIKLNSSAYAQYLKYMTLNAGSGSNPNMTSIELQITLNLDTLRISSIAATEKYSITQLGLRVNCTSKVTYTFRYGNYSGDALYKEIKSVLGV